MKVEKVCCLDDAALGVRILKIKDYPPHWHDRVLEIIYVLRGTANIITSFEDFVVEENQFVLINEGEIHHIHSEQPCDIISLYIHLSHFKQHFKCIEFLYFSWESFNQNPRQNDTSLRNIILNLFWNQLGDQEKSNRQSLNKIGFDILNILVHHFDIIHYYTQKPPTKEQLLKYHSMIQYMEENYANAIRMASLAREEFLSINYVSQFWKNMTSMNFTVFLNSRRVEFAEKYMVTTNMSMEAISEKCGFSDRKYFYKNFKKWYRCTPYEHKKKLLHHYGKIAPQYEELVADIRHEQLQDRLIQNNPGFFYQQGWQLPINNQETQLLISLHQHVLAEKENPYALDQTILDVVRLQMNTEYVICFEIDCHAKSQDEWRSLLQWFETQRAAIFKSSQCQYQYHILYHDPFDLDPLVSFIDKLTSFLNPELLKISIRF